MKLPILSIVANKPRRRILRPGRTNSALFASSTAVAAPTVISVPESVPTPPAKPVSEVLAGATARVASQATIHPLDTLKVRLQTTSKAIKGIGRTSPGLHCGLRGVLTLYKGVLGAAAGAGFAIGTYFAFYTAARNLMTRRTNFNSSAIAFVSAGTAAAGCSVVKVPLAVCIRSVQAGVYKHPLEAAISIIRAVGIRGLFTGYLPTVVEDVPDMAVKFAAYETMRSVHKSFLTDRQPSAQEDFIFGAISGALAAACTTPVDVVKTNMMCQATSRPSMTSIAKKIMQRQGLKGFFQGVGPRALSNGMNSAIFFCFFEAFRSVLLQKQNRPFGGIVGLSKTNAMHEKGNS